MNTVFERYEDIKRLAYLLNIMNTVFERYEDIKRVPTSGVLARLLPRKAPLLEWRQLALFKPKRLSQTLLKIRNAWRGNYWEKFVVVLSSGESSLKSLGGVSRWPGYISYLQSYQTWYSSLPDTSECLGISELESLQSSPINESHTYTQGTSLCAPSNPIFSDFLSWQLLFSLLDTNMSGSCSARVPLLARKRWQQGRNWSISVHPTAPLYSPSITRKSP